MISRWAVSLLGHELDLNRLIAAQLPKNDYVDQFNFEPTHGLAMLAGFFVVFVIGSMLALKSKDVR